MITNLNDVYSFLYDWIYLVLNTKNTRNIDIIIGEQNVSSSDRKYIVIHEPPISNRKVGDTNRKSVTSIDLSGGNIKGKKTYTNTYQVTISIEEIQGQNNIDLLEQTIEEEDVMEFWRNEKISFMQMEAGTDNNKLMGTIFEKRYIKDLILLYTIENIYNGYYIENINYTSNYTRGG